MRRKIVGLLRVKLCKCVPKSYFGKISKSRKLGMMKSKKGKKFDFSVFSKLSFKFAHLTTLVCVRR